METDMNPVRSSIRTLSAALFTLVALIALTPAQATTEIVGTEKIIGSGTIQTETRGVSGFRGVSLAISAQVTLRQGDHEGLKISGDDNVLPLVETVVENGTLKIRWAGGAHYQISAKALEIVIDARSIDGLAVRGSGEIRADRLTAGHLNAAITGSGAIVVDNLDVDALDVALAGSGHLNAGGRADLLVAALSGSGELSAAKLASRRARIALHGSPQASVWAKDELKASIAGSGDIKYYGKPRLTQTIAGSGTIR